MQVISSLEYHGPPPKSGKVGRSVFSPIEEIQILGNIRPVYYSLPGETCAARLGGECD